MYFIGGKVLYCTLAIKTVVGTYREKRGDLNRCFYIKSMCIQTPVIMIVTVVSADNDLIPKKITGTESQWYFNPGIRKIFNMQTAVIKKYPVKRQTQVALLVNNIKQKCYLHPLIDDLRVG